MQEALSLPAEVTEAINEMRSSGAFGKVLVNFDNGCIASVETRRIRKVRKVDDSRKQ